MWGISKFEKHRTHSAFLVSATYKIFLAQFLNTSILILIANMELTIFIQTEAGESGFGLADDILGGDFKDFTVKWFNDVGVALMITLLFGIFTPHIKGIR